MLRKARKEDGLLGKSILRGADRIFMNIIVMDLEWNQSDSASPEEIEALPFEIVEIGAVRLTSDGMMTGEFNELVKPDLYQEMHQITGKLIHLQMRELQRGEPFVEVMGRFFAWCGEDYRFCTWGTQDLVELQRNVRYHKMTPLSQGPIAYLDAQKLFSLAFEDGKSRRALEYAVDYLGIEKDIPFHRAFSDAYYTAEVLKKIMEAKPEVLQKVSYDVFCPPKDRASEIKVQFDTYFKYISREFATKTEVFADREVSSSKCYLCHRNLRKKLKWFTPNGRHYYCLAYCEKHGFLKGKIRMKKSQAGNYFVVKTTKLITETEAEAIRERCNHAKELRKKRVLQREPLPEAGKE